MQKDPQIIFSVIIADEESTVFTGLREFLGEINHIKLTHVKSITDLFEWFGNNKIPDLVLLDSGFGDGLAYAIISYLKKKYTPSPIIVVMPYFGMTPLTLAVLSGCDEVICKPTHLEELMTVLNKWDGHVITKK